MRWCILMVALVTLGCDGSGLEPGAAATPDATTPDTTTDATPEETGTVFEVSVPLTPLTPQLPAVAPLPSGLTDGSTLVIAKTALEGRFLFGMGADPSGLIASVGGGAAGLTPIRAKIVLAPSEADATQGIFEIRALDGNDKPIMSATGLLERYAYSEPDADTIRVELATTDSPLELAIYGTCRLERASYTLKGAPVYADGLMTWPTEERYTRAGNCQQVPRETVSLHVHYLRSDLAGRNYVARSVKADSPFGYFLGGDDLASATLARLPGIAADEPARTYTYYLVNFPDAMVPAAERTFEAWNDVLEEITGRRPFRTERAPEGLIPWDPRFNAVVWAEGEGAAVAPFTNDPETGEIFQSLVVMWFTDIGDLVDTYRDFLDTDPEVADSLLPKPGPAPLPAFAGFDSRAVSSAIATNPAELARPVRRADVAPRVMTTRSFTTRPLLPHDLREIARTYSDEEVSDVVVVDFLLHEMGHNLGLRHNFTGSVDKHRHLDTQTSSTTMDYVLGMGVPGSYDRDAMRYGYGSTPPESVDYLYCTDETMDLDPACAQWDLGHPVRYLIDELAGYFETYDARTPAAEIQNVLYYYGLTSEMSRARTFINSAYEDWDETPVATFDALLALVDCGNCRTHPALRSELARYLLYSRHQVTAWWELNAPNIWLDYPGFTVEQTIALTDTYFALVTSASEPLALRTAIVDKLPTSAVPGAKELLGALHDHFSALTPTGDDLTVKTAVETAFAAL